MSDSLVKYIGAGVLGALVTVSTIFTANEVAHEKPPETPAVEAPCPDGWADTSKEVEHAIVLSCEKDQWLVILHVDGTFSHGLQKNTPGAVFVYDPREVTGWPAQ
jgi:hypothetical protein